MDVCAWASWTSAPTPGTCSVVDAFRGGPPRAGTLLQGAAAAGRAPRRRPGRHRRRRQPARQVRRGGARRRPRTRAAPRSSRSRRRRCATRSTPTRSSPGSTQASGIDLQVLAGPDEARLTFLAVRRWFGWSAGRLGVFDIGGGSLEIAGGCRREPRRRAVDAARRRAADPRVARRRPHARRAAPVRPLDDRRRGRSDPARWGVRPCRRDEQDVPLAGPHLRCGAVLATGQYVRRVLHRRDLSRAGRASCARCRPRRSASCPGVSPDRAYQIRAGAIVAEATMDLFDLAELEICPWALREGVLLEHLDHL